MNTIQQSQSVLASRVRRANPKTGLANAFSSLIKSEATEQTSPAQSNATKPAPPTDAQSTKWVRDLLDSLTDEQIETLRNKYDVENLTSGKGAALLDELQGMGLLEENIHYWNSGMVLIIPDAPFIPLPRPESLSPGRVIPLWDSSKRRQGIDMEKNQLESYIEKYGNQAHMASSVAYYKKLIGTHEFFADLYEMSGEYLTPSGTFDVESGIVAQK